MTLDYVSVGQTYLVNLCLIQTSVIISTFYFKSTLLSRPNKVGLKWPSVCTYVHAYVRTSICPQKVSSILIKFGMWVEVDEWCTTVCSMTRVKVMSLSPWKLEIIPFSKAIFFCHLQWELATVHWVLNYGKMSKFDWAGHLIFILVFVWCDFELGRKVSCEESTVSPTRG